MAPSYLLSNELMTVDEQILQIGADLGYKDLRIVPNQGLCAIESFIFTHAIVVGIDELGYSRRYCYHRRIEAVRALQKWDGESEEPDGPWIKCKGDCKHN